MEFCIFRFCFRSSYICCKRCSKCLLVATTISPHFFYFALICVPADNLMSITDEIDCVSRCMQLMVKRQFPKDAYCMIAYILRTFSKKLSNNILVCVNVMPCTMRFIHVSPSVRRGYVSSIITDRQLARASLGSVVRTHSKSLAQEHVWPDMACFGFEESVPPRLGVRAVASARFIGRIGGRDRGPLR
jgi:hypothetical protein